MSDRTVTILVWMLIGGLGGAVLVTARRLRTRVPGLGDLVTGSDLLTHVAVSLKRVLVGLGVAVAIGVPLGLAVGS